MKDDIINLGGTIYDGKTGRQLNNAKNVVKQPGKATTLNRQYVKKPNVKTSAHIAAPDNRAAKPEVRQFQRGIIAPGTTMPTAKNVSHFNRGDFNNTDRPIIIDIKPKTDVIVTAEQNQKFIEAVKRAKNTELVRRRYTEEIIRARRQQMGIISQTSRNLMRRQVVAKDSSAKDQPTASSELRQAQKDSIINQALANAPISDQLAGNYKKTSPTKFKFQPLKLIIGLLVVVLFAGLIYLNWSNLEFNYAKLKLEIDAKMPAYIVPDYTLSRENQIKDGRLVLTYQNRNGQTYTISQSKTSLDSQGVLVNIIKPVFDENYSIYRRNGLTIYLGGSKTAAWSNGGILYRIEVGDELSAETLRQLATSL